MIRITKKHLLQIRRKEKSKKGDNGKVLIVGGSKQYSGALTLAGLAAMRAGVDWVTVAAPQKVAWAINALSPDIVTTKLPGDYLDASHYKAIVMLSKKHNCILLGNGAGMHAGTKKLFQKMVKDISLPMVIDADALKVLKPQEIKNAIVTPHAREAEIFFGSSDVKKIQKKVGSNVCLLKGPTDYIITKNKMYSNTTGNAGMTKAGTGDVLAGLCSGYLAQSNELEKSAITACYINGQIGDMLLKQRKGEFSYIASDLVRDIKEIRNK